MLKETGMRAKAAARVLAGCSEKEKNDALFAMASALEEDMDVILGENKKDVEEGVKGGLTAAFTDRLTLTEERIRAMAEGMRAAAALPDPVGRTLSEKTLQNGLGLTDITTKGHYTEDAWFIPALKELSMTHPVAAMEDESAIFIQEGAVWSLGKIHWIDNGEIRDWYS